MQGARPGWGVDQPALHAPPPPPPDAKKKKKERPHNRFCITAFIDTKEYRKHRRGGGGRFKRCMGSERNWEIYATMLSISQQQKECVAVM